MNLRTVSAAIAEIDLRAAQSKGIEVKITLAHFLPNMALLIV